MIFPTCTSINDTADAGSDESSYSKLITVFNRLINPSGMAGFGANALESDHQYQRALSEVRTTLGRNIDFANQNDREAIGNQLIQDLKLSGACTPTGSHIARC
jgi:hypothetical protein